MAPSGTSGIHKHLVADEFFYVLEGSGRMLIGETDQVIEAGDFIVIPFNP
jgi:quercetin dioxygenase-like cupin family protein